MRLENQCGINQAKVKLFKIPTTSTNTEYFGKALSSLNEDSASEHRETDKFHFWPPSRHFLKRTGGQKYPSVLSALSSLGLRNDQRPFLLTELQTA